MPDLNTANTGDRENKASGFNPLFAQPTGEFLTHHGTFLHSEIDSIEEARIRAGLSVQLNVHEDEVTVLQIRGYKILQGKVLVSGDFKDGYFEIEDEQERFDYVIKMSRRDEYVQFTSAFYSTAAYGVSQKNTEYPKNYASWRFESVVDAQNFYITLKNYESNSTDFQEFMGEILAYSRRISEELDIKDVRPGILNLFMFNHCFSQPGEERKLVLEGLSIPVDEVPNIDLRDRISMEQFLHDSTARLSLAKNIAVYFLHFNARPYLNLI